MLTISKPLSAGPAQTYHQKEFTAKEQNYWSQQGVIAGEWQGKLAAQFGLAGAVSDEDFLRLCQGQYPQTGDQIVRRRASYEYQDAKWKTIKTMEHRAGWDATFFAPRSVSLTALGGGDDLVREAHRRAFVQPLISSNITRKPASAATIRPKPRPSLLPPSLSMTQLAQWMDTSRHRCTHAVVFNVTERNNGQLRAIQPQSLFASQQLATAKYQSELTYKLRQLGYEITIRRSGPATLLRPAVLSPVTVPPCLFPLPLKVKEETSRKLQKEKKHEIRRSQHTNERGSGFPRRSIGVRSQ